MMFPDTEKIDEFKARIGFDTLPKRGKGWRLRDGVAMLSMTVFVSSEEHARARNVLVETASTSMLSRVHFERVNTGLGDLCVGYFSKTQHDLLWVRDTIVVRLWLEGRLFDLMPLAREIDDLAKAATVDDLAPHRPRIRSLRTTNTKVRVGERVDVQVDGVVAGRSGRAPMLHFDTPMEVITEENDGSVAQLSVDEAGSFEVGVALIDPLTLLSCRASFDLEATK